VLVTIFLGADPLSARISLLSTLVASGLLCDSGNCPASAKSVNGDTYEITGAGTFNAQTKSVSAAGTSAHKIPNGTVETGVWTSNQLISFDMALRRMRFGSEAWLHEFQASAPIHCRCPSVLYPSAAWRYSVSACCPLRECQ
jgi:hypothetical protein